MSGHRGSTFPQRLALGALVCILWAAAPRAAVSEAPGPAVARPVLDPNADAEVVHCDIRVVDGVVAQGFNRLVEMRRTTAVFTARGADAEGVSSITYGRGTTVEYVSVRITTPDGAKRTLTPEKMFDQDLVRSGGLRLRRKSFVVPGIVPGSLVEVYSRTRSTDRRYVPDCWVLCQEDVPIRSLRLRIRPWKDMTFTLRTSVALRPAEPISVDPDGYRVIVLKDIPAWRFETWMPDMGATSPIVWGEYQGAHEAPRLVQALIGRGRTRKELAANLPVVDSMRTLAAEIVQGATTPAERAERLHRYCRDRIRNLSAVADSTGAGAPNRSGQSDVRPWTTLSRGEGSGLAVNLAFAGLAVAAELDVRLVLVGAGIRPWFGQSESIDDVEDVLVALSGPGGWHFYDPGSPGRPTGVISPSVEGTTAFLTNGGEPVPIQIPRAPAAHSRLTRAAELRLSPEGDAEGSLEVTWSGHALGDLREALEDVAVDERRTWLLAGLSRRWPNAEVDSFVFVPSADRREIEGWRCRVRLAKYATVAGDVMLAPMDPFEELHVDVLADSARRSDVHWDYSWTESDRIRLSAPAGGRVLLPALPGDVTLEGIFHGGCRGKVVGPGDALEFERTATFTRPRDGSIPRERWNELRARIGASLAHGRLDAEVIRTASPGQR